MTNKESLELATNILWNLIQYRDVNMDDYDEDLTKLAKKLRMVTGTRIASDSNTEVEIPAIWNK